MFRAKLAAIFTLLLGPFVAFVGFEEKQRTGRIEEEGVEVVGIPTHGRVDPGRRGIKTYRVTVTYPAGGPPNARSKEFKVTSGFFESITTGGTITAKRVKVRMLPDNLDEAIIVDGSADDGWMFPVGIGAFVLGGVSTFLLFRKGRQA